MVHMDYIVQSKSESEIMKQLPVKCKESDKTLLAFHGLLLNNRSLCGLHVSPTIHGQGQCTEIISH